MQGISTAAEGNNDEFDEEKINWRLLLAGVLLVVLRASQTLVDLALVLNKRSYQQKWIGVFVLFAVSGYATTLYRAQEFWVIILTFG